MTKLRLRQLHFWLAPVMVFPVLLSAITGSLFRIATMADRASDFRWLLLLHRGNFGPINLEGIYPFLNALGVLVLAGSGIGMWLQARPPRRRKRAQR